MNSGNNDNFFTAILAGGSGTRLWPLSTAACPKPFVPLGPLGSLYSETVARARTLGTNQVLTVGAGVLRNHCEIPGVDFLEEPGARNTAAAVALAGAWAWRAVGGAGTLLVLPADHHIPEVKPFADTVRHLARVARAEKALGVMGIFPTGPEVSYGYIEQGEACSGGFRVARFIEKPDRPKAEAMLAQGNTAWNSGMFVFPLDALKEEMAAHAPGLWDAAEAWLLRRNPTPYMSLKSISVDYALMEKSSRVVMVPARFPWSDVGTFAALFEFLGKDARGNAGWGPGLVEDCSGCLVVTRTPRTLVRGMTDVAVVETEGGLLVTPLKGSDGIRSGVEAILKGS